MPNSKVLLSLFLIIILTSCSPFETFDGMGQKETLFNDQSIATFGATANISWNITNGALTSLTVVYPANTLNDVALKTLEQEVKQLVKSIYGHDSYTIILAINLTG